MRTFAPAFIESTAGISSGFSVKVTCEHHDLTCNRFDSPVRFVRSKELNLVSRGGQPVSSHHCKGIESPNGRAWISDWKISMSGQKQGYSAGGKRPHSPSPLYPYAHNSATAMECLSATYLGAKALSRTKKVFIGGVATSTTESDLRAFFGEFGTVSFIYDYHLAAFCLDKQVKPQPTCIFLHRKWIRVGNLNRSVPSLPVVP